MNALKKLEQYRIPTHSPSAAVQYLYSKFTSKHQFENLLSSILDKKIKYSSELVSKYVCGYVVSNIVKDPTAPMDRVLETSEQAGKLFAATKEEQISRYTTYDDAPVAPKQTKLQRAVDLYQKNQGQPDKFFLNEFMSKLDMSKAGARSYLHKLKKEFST